MFFLYDIFIRFYILAIRAASPFNLKARKWMAGRKNLFSRIAEALPSGPESRRTAWFHCASLGEFEQGRPVLEAFRQARPDYRIVLTFFSPSGYEVRKKYSGADLVFYLPADTKANAERFIRTISPDLVFFIKYEYWYNYLSVLKKNSIPIYMVSAIFRSSQPFFKWYGGWFRKQLGNISWFFLQDPGSESLLNSIGIRQSCSVSGDTRFDRVAAIAGQNESVPWMDEFCGNSTVLLAGSTWPEDESRIFPYLTENKDQIKIILVPHEVHKERIDGILEKTGYGTIRYSEACNKNVSGARILVVDTIGILAFLYRYAGIAYIGGGFGAGIHNILEAAAFGVPVIFGPNHLRFREATDLLRQGGAFTVGDETQFRSRAQQLLENIAVREHASAVCRTYVSEKKGATSHILGHIHA